MLGALIDRLRLGSSPEVRLLWHRAFHRWWDPTMLTGSLFEDTMQDVRRPTKRGRPVRPNQLRARYNALLDLTELLALDSPSLTRFRQALESWHRADLLSKGPSRLPVYRLYLLHDHPARLVVALLRADTGKSVKAIRRQIRERTPKAPPAV